MAMMYANQAVGVQQKIDLSAYEDAETELVHCTAECEEASTRAGECDEASTRASSGGSDHASNSSGSDDEGNSKALNTQVKRGHVMKPKLMSVQPPQITAPVVQPLPSLLSFPPGLEPPPGLDMPIPMGPPGLTHPSMDTKPAAPPAAPYTCKEFRRTMTAIFKEIRQARTATLTGAVERVRAANVPEADQPALFSEMMTRAVEEMSGPGRRLCMAFVTGVAAGSPSAFCKDACLAGIRIFFQDTYDDLMSEVPKLPVRVEREFMPVLRTAFSAQELNEVLPPRLRVAS